MKRLLAIGAALSSLAFGVRADPGPVVDYLMSTPASIFSIGLARIQRNLDEITSQLKEQLLSTSSKQKAKGLFVRSGVNYLSNENRITIKLTVFNFESDESQIIKPSKNSCKALLNTIRDKAGVNGKTGEFYLNELRKKLSMKWIPRLESSFFANYFERLEYLRKDAPKDYLKKLDKIFVVQVSVSSLGGGAVRCEGPLVSKKVLYE